MAALPLLITDGLFTCPRCAFPSRLVNAGGLGFPLSGFCARCEHRYAFTVGAPSTTTTGALNVAGATTLTVAAGAAFSTVGAWIVVDSSSVDGGAEVLKTSAIGTSTAIPIASSPLRLSHAAGASVQTATLAPYGGMT